LEDPGDRLEVITGIHSAWRYAVLLAAAGAIVVSLWSFVGSRDWDLLSDRAALVFTVAMDIQVVTGVIVWLFGSAPSDDVFLRWIHPVAMIVAAGMAHAGKVLSERAGGSRASGRIASVFFVGSLLLVLLAIPLA
jgi:hypothetical protein